MTAAGLSGLKSSFGIETVKRRDGKAQQSLQTLIQQLGGQVLAESLHDGIAYHGILAELPANAIQAVVDNPNTELVKCDSVMFFRPVGQMLAR
jgi:hypothetical protein